MNKFLVIMTILNCVFAIGYLVMCCYYTYHNNTVLIWFTGISSLTHAVIMKNFHNM